MKLCDLESPLFQRILQSWNEYIKLFLDTAIKESLLQIPAVLMQLWHGTFRHELVKRLR
jgi:hypothetical protein